MARPVATILLSLLFAALTSLAAGASTESAPASGILGPVITAVCGAAATIFAAWLAARNFLLTIQAGKDKDRDVLRRQTDALQECLAADIRGILRVINVARIVDQCLIRYIDPETNPPIATGPRSEDYFALYTSIAKDLGMLDRGFAVRASAFYVVLKGSRDTAKAYESYQLPARGAGVSAQRWDGSVRNISKGVLEMLEHVYRNGFLAIAMMRRLADVANESVDSEDLVSTIFKNWIFLTAIHDLLAGPSLTTGFDEATFHVSLHSAMKTHIGSVQSSLREADSPNIPDGAGGVAYDASSRTVDERFDLAPGIRIP